MSLLTGLASITSISAPSRIDPAHNTTTRRDTSECILVFLWQTYSAVIETERVVKLSENANKHRAEKCVVRSDGQNYGTAKT